MDQPTASPELQPNTSSEPVLQSSSLTPELPDKSPILMMIIAIVAVVLILIGLGALWFFVIWPSFTPQEDVAKNQPLRAPLTQNQKIAPPAGNQPLRAIPSPIPTPVPTPLPSPVPDTPSTLESPVKITMSDGEHFIYYAQPAGQNNKAVKKIIFSLPGHGSTAEQDYSAWKTQLLADGSYALASMNWWDGKGENIPNYLSPPQVSREIQYFLKNQGYKESDLIVLEGFSRGSANTYSVVASNLALHLLSIDAVISASGKYQSDFAMTPQLLAQNDGQPFEGVAWILACGAKDPNPTRDGCEGMKETQTFLQEKGANVLALLEDPNGGHGAFHMSSLKLAQQALSMLTKQFKL